MLTEKSHLLVGNGSIDEFNIVLSSNDGLTAVGRQKLIKKMPLYMNSYCSVVNSRGFFSRLKPRTDDNACGKLSADAAAMSAGSVEPG